MATLFRLIIFSSKGTIWKYGILEATETPPEIFRGVPISNENAIKLSGIVFSK